ncbi:phosphate ABC transporter permease subunit PstC [Nocardioides panacisoli]|uniref:phosphate ABC transporter permease subunit PstC n=1 Tax=Nocardioides panacisoli TaxID=627624 RepID=UPI001C630979|nr:phosphate ABC transporter permease subunit PstC [Nocardioides panacisoli]QYJ03908.1 phosphate ABC transporter permease subunit PstC [Nocardioides panacisoli]
MSAIADPPAAELADGNRRVGDAVFSRAALIGALLVIVFLAGVGAFLVIQGMPALGAEDEQVWDKDNLWGLVGPLLFGTVLASMIAMVIVAPLAVGLGLVISHYAPRRLAKPVGFLVDLLAAVPSVVFGLWGAFILAPYLQPLHQFLVDYFGWIPLFDGPASATARTILTAGVVLALMALPIVTAIMREVFAQTPSAHEEAALALGATRWEMIKLAVFPYARSGMVAALLLGLGRALGETMAVAMVLSTTGVIVSFDIVSSENSNTIAAFIANSFKEASGLKINVLIFCGLALFVLTFLVNFIGRWVATRGVAKA